MNIVTCIAPVNIAVIKYWGKRNEDLILPLNDSISATLNMDQMRATTTVMASPNFTEDKIWLNGKEEAFLTNPRLLNCVREIKVIAKQNSSAEENKMLDWHIHICSENNFPTAAGLASSAAGYACLVYALAQLYGVKGDLSTVARQGSGSACRSIYGGFVQWHRGMEGDTEEARGSFAEQLVNESHWPELRIVILVVNDVKKKTSSAIGMKRSTETSELLRHRIQISVPRRIEAMKKAIREKDFETFAEVTMKDSNQLHAVCLDTYPPAVYMNDVSHSIVELVHAYNSYLGKTEVAYTFDAGPNACLFLMEKNVSDMLSLINYAFPHSNGEGYFRGIPITTRPLPEDIHSSLNVKPHRADLLKYIIQTKLGPGPRQIEEHLLNSSGEPI
ncbi:diphosphomevalonate decarboxylase [Ischnura elegans]|uniref:diphosphomevalonate decarboxylase n=1 Tax=Ischnura elegans TaxID=197161 RepID=UPI001ED8A627|nr:diphosphomevalonate decarboxylase [Ischnura elegans]